MAKRIFCLVLCCLTLATSFASCGGNDQKQKNTSSTSSTQTQVKKDDKTTLSDDEIKTINEKIDYLKKDAPNGYDGVDFNFIGRESDSFPIEENITGNEESDAVYKRNMAVEEAFNVKIVNHSMEKGPVVAQTVMTDADAGLNTYHLAFGNIFTVGAPLFNGSYLSTIGDVDKIDIESPWWLSSMEEFYAIGDKLFFLSGDILPSFFSNSTCVLYSKKIAEDYGITDDFYSIVKSGDWTIDKMFEAASKVPGGEIKRYGNPDADEAGIALLFGSGQSITKFDADHIPYLEKALSSEIMDLATKVSAQTGREEFCQNANFEIEEIGSKEIRQMFADDKILFSFDTAEGISELRELDVNGFGILPIPKGSAEQKNYISYTGTGGGGSIYITRNIPDKDMVGTITEAMGAYSYLYIRPTFYDLRLKSKSVYDMESKEMLDIIYSTQVYDLYDLYGEGSWESGNGPMFKMLNEAVFLKTDGLASGYASMAKVTQNKVKFMLKKAEAYENR